MDYKVMENGAFVWYKIIGDNELPTKVCFIQLFKLMMNNF